MDSQSVIDTFEACPKFNETKLIKQRDKYIWRELIKEKKHWGKGRIRLFHVESHVNEKRDKTGNK